MSKDDIVEIIPHALTRDDRLVVRGDINSGVGNVRMQVRLVDTPDFAVDLGGTELAQRMAEMIRAKLAENFSQGLDAQGRALPPVTEETRRRRTRRRFQREDDLGAKAERFKLRGRGQKGARGSYEPTDRDTPFHESGLAAENVVVTFKSTERGEPTFLIALPSGGKARGLVNDDGRGARLFAAEHYGFERLMDIPHELDAAINDAMAGHLGDVLASGGSVLKLIGRTVAKAAAVVDQGASGDFDE